MAEVIIKMFGGTLSVGYDKEWKSSLNESAVVRAFSLLKDCVFKQCTTDLLKQQLEPHGFKFKSYAKEGECEYWWFGLEDAPANNDPFSSVNFYPQFVLYPSPVGFHNGAKDVTPIEFVDRENMNRIETHLFHSDLGFGGSVDCTYVSTETLFPILDEYEEYIKKLETLCGIDR